jgi:hypothetical protein
MKTTMQETTVMDTSATRRTGGPQGRKIRQSKMPNRTIQFSRKQQHLAADGSKRHLMMGLLLIRWEAAKRRQGRGANLWPMGKRSLMQRKAQKR